MIVIQSYVDLITNSSTTVYQMANNIKSVKEIIDSILKITGSSYTCDDLFDIKINYDATLDDAEDYYIAIAEELKEGDSKVKELLYRYYSAPKKDWRTARSYLEDLYNHLIENYKEDVLDINSWADNNSEYSFNSYYSFVSKNPVSIEAARVLKQINDLFAYEANYDG